MVLHHFPNTLVCNAYKQEHPLTLPQYNHHTQEININTIWSPDRETWLLSLNMFTYLINPHRDSYNKSPISPSSPNLGPLLPSPRPWHSTSGSPFMSMPTTPYSACSDKLQQSAPPSPHLSSLPSTRPAPFVNIPLSQLRCLLPKWVTLLPSHVFCHPKPGCPVQGTQGHVGWGGCPHNTLLSSLWLPGPESLLTVCFISLTKVLLFLKKTGIKIFRTNHIFNFMALSSLSIEGRWSQKLLYQECSSLDSAMIVLLWHWHPSHFTGIITY